MSLLPWIRGGLVIASAPCVGARQDDSIKGICSPGSLGPNPGSIQLDSAASMLHSYQMEMSSFTFQMLQSGKYNFICFKLQTYMLQTFFFFNLL